MYGFHWPLHPNAHGPLAADVTYHFKALSCLDFVISGKIDRALQINGHGLVGIYFPCGSKG